jgi:hypothetical protein
MKQFFIGLFIVIAVASLEFACTQSAHAQTAGLNYQNYAAGGAQPTYTQDANGNITNRTLLSTGTVNTVGLTTSSGTNVATRSDGFIIRFYGYINIPTAGTYYFGGQADDGIRIKINNVSVVDSWIESGGAFRQSSPITLAAGTVAVEVMYYENGGGQMVNFQWYTPNATAWAIVPSTVLATDSTYWAPVAPPYSSGITASQQTRKDSAATRRQTVTSNNVYIDQVGDNNTVTVNQQGNNNQLKGIGQSAASIQGNSNNITVRQGTTSGNSSGKNLVELQVIGDTNTVNLNQGRNADGSNSGADSNNHYQMLNLNGSGNTVTTVQKDGTNAGAGHFMETTISGSSNVVNLTQQGTAGKVLFTNVNGNNNTVNTNQKDSGTHYLDVGLIGNGHTVNVTQEGVGNHAATINLTNSGAGGTVNLNQLGSTGQVYSIQQSCTTPSCGATITQGQ